MSCYSNASLILPTNAIRYDNLTFQSCRCLIIQMNISGFQYNTDDNSCYTFGNNSSLSDIRITINSQVCFVNRTSMLYLETTSSNTIQSSPPPPPSPPATISTSATGSTYFTKESIFLTNSIPLTSLLIVVTVPKTLGVYNPRSSTTFWQTAVSNTINDTDTIVIFIFQIINQQTIIASTWEIDIYFNLGAQVRATNNDTYTIQIGSYPTISGHF